MSLVFSYLLPVVKVLRNFLQYFTRKVPMRTSTNGFYLLCTPSFIIFALAASKVGVPGLCLNQQNSAVCLISERVRVEPLQKH